MSGNSKTNYRSDDETLVYHCLAGDENAFGFLVHKYKDLVHAYAYQKVSNYADAEDITQEVFIRAYRNLAKLKYPHKFRSWLYTIASNECKRWLSKSLSRREKEVNLEDAPEYAFSFEPSFAQMPTDWQIDLEEALEDLPEDNRIAVSMFYMSDCSLKEIGEYLGVSVNTVKGKLHRARQQLGDTLSERYGRSLSKKKLKGGFIMQILEQLHHISRPMIPPAWQRYLSRQIPTAIAMAACVLMGVLGILSEDVQDKSRTGSLPVEMSEASRLVLGETRQSSAQSVEVVWLGELPGPSQKPSFSQKLGFYTSDEKAKSEKDAQVLAEADALLTAKKYRQAAGAYRLLLDSTSSDEITFAAYYGLGMSLYKWDRTASDRTDEAIGMLMLIPENNKQWVAAQLLSGRCFLRKGIWEKEKAEKQEYYEEALKAFQAVLGAQTKDDLRKFAKQSRESGQAKYLREICQVERGEADPKAPAVRKLLEMARQDEDSAIRFVAADALNIPIPGMRIVGTVTDKLTGQPVADALVSISGVGNDITDGQGQYSINNLPGRKGKAILWVDIKGYGKKMVQLMISETEIDTQVDVQLGPGATVVGRVVDSDGLPVSGAVASISDLYQIRHIKTDVEGKYQLVDIEVRQDAYHLSVQHPNFTEDNPIPISVSKTGIVEVPDIVLTRGVTLKGRVTDGVTLKGHVTDELGNLIEGAKIKPSRNVKTNANGEFYLRKLGGDSTTVIVDSSNFMPAYKRVGLDADKELPPVDFVLKSGKTLIGRVVDEQGKPIEGVRLQFQTWEAVQYYWFDHYATTDASGEFRMEHLPEGNITLRLDRKGYLYMNGQPAEVESNQPITTMKNPIVMKKGARAYAKVVDAETGKPIRRFKVKGAFSKQLEPGDIRIDGIPADWTIGFVFQSSTGKFKTFERFRGMVIALQVEAEGYAPTYVPRVVLGTYDKEPLIIRMKEQKPIKGIVVDAETGKTLAGAFITTFDKNHHLLIHSAGTEYGATEPVGADAQGKFVLPGALAEEFYLCVTHPERAAAIVGPLRAPTDEKQQPVRVEMQKGGVITGTAVLGLKIALSLLGRHPYLGVELQAEPSRDGIYRFENLMQGKYQLLETIWNEGFSYSGRIMLLELQPGETKTLNFRRTNGTRLYGKVTEVDGTPIKNVVIGARMAKKPLSYEMRFECSGTAITDADGRYEIVGLPPGNYQLRAEIKFLKPPKPRKTASTFTIEEGDKEVGLDIVFPK